jgi:maltose O-acetyltransferase
MYAKLVAKAFDRFRYRYEFAKNRLKWRLMGLRTGRGVQIYGRVFIYDAARVTIGDNSTIGAFAVLMASGGILIGQDVLISSHCSIFSVSHDVDARRGGLLFRDTRLMAEVRIGDNVWIGTGVRILPGVSIGANTVVGAGSVVTRSLPSGVVAVGVPASVVRTLEGPPEAK